MERRNIAPPPAPRPDGLRRGFPYTEKPGRNWERDSPGARRRGAEGKAARMGLGFSYFRGFTDARMGCGNLFPPSLPQTGRSRYLSSEKNYMSGLWASPLSFLIYFGLRFGA